MHNLKRPTHVYMHRCLNDISSEDTSLNDCGKSGGGGGGGGLSRCIDIERSERSSHTHGGIRGCNSFREKTNLSKIS